MGSAYRERNGFDLVSVLLCAAALVLFIVGNIYTLSAGGLCIVLALLRGLSTNTIAREKEAYFFTNSFRRLLVALRNLYRKFTTFVRERKQYRIFKCPQCGQSLRVPRRKGKIRIHCSLCGNTFEKKT